MTLINWFADLSPGTAALIVFLLMWASAFVSFLSGWCIGCSVGKRNAQAALAEAHAEPPPARLRHRLARAVGVETASVGTRRALGRLARRSGGARPRSRRATRQGRPTPGP